MRVLTTKLKMMIAYRCHPYRIIIVIKFLINSGDVVHYISVFFFSSFIFHGSLFSAISITLFRHFPVSFSSNLFFFFYFCFPTTSSYIEKMFQKEKLKKEEEKISKFIYIMGLRKALKMLLSSRYTCSKFEYFEALTLHYI